MKYHVAGCPCDQVGYMVLAREITRPPNRQRLRYFNCLPRLALIAHSLNRERSRPVVPVLKLEHLEVAEADGMITCEWQVQFILQRRERARHRGLVRAEQRSDVGQRVMQPRPHRRVTERVLQNIAHGRDPCWASRGPASASGGISHRRSPLEWTEIAGW